MSVVPSLDTGVCQIQTKKFNESLASMGDSINAITVSLDLPFAQNRFCGAENIKSMRVAERLSRSQFRPQLGPLDRRAEAARARRVRAR